MHSNSICAIRQKAARWMLQGISPRRLALTLALGFAIGCIPVVGVPTVLCAALALALRLNQPAIQAANYIAMPLQVLLILPFMRMGNRLFAFGSGRAFEAGALLHTTPMVLIAHIGALAGQALLAWLVIAIPAVALMTAMLTVLLRRVPALATASSGD
jgi:uncharacterized protein (DUF2062 family)